MRCKNCGWVNPSNNAKCEKCNVPLTGSLGEPELPEKPSAGNVEPKETAKGCPGCGYPVRAGETACPRCGCLLDKEIQDIPVVEEEKPQKDQPSKDQQPATEPKPFTEEPARKICDLCKESVPETAKFCPNCGASFTKESKKIEEGTINPWMPSEQVHIQHPECTLKVVSKDGEQVNDALLRFSGNVIHLNRGNTEPGNQTITSKVQAELIFENNKWYLRDKSVLKTTYIYAGEKKELKPEDIIVLGNRSFEFKYVSENLPE